MVVLLSYGPWRCVMQREWHAPSAAAIHQFATETEQSKAGHVVQQQEEHGVVVP